MGTLKGVGHWVVEEVRRHLSTGTAAKKRRTTPVTKRSAAPAQTPGNFQWWYIDARGKAVVERSSAQVAGYPGAQQYRVSILHSTGRMERAWLPETKAPPRGPI